LSPFNLGCVFFREPRSRPDFWWVFSPGPFLIYKAWSDGRFCFFLPSWFYIHVPCPGRSLVAPARCDNGRAHPLPARFRGAPVFETRPWETASFSCTCRPAAPLSRFVRASSPLLPRVLGAKTTTGTLFSGEVVCFCCCAQGKRGGTSPLFLDQPSCGDLIEIFSFSSQEAKTPKVAGPG